jgi:hypothetical protein
MVAGRVKLRPGCRRHKERRKATPGVSHRRDAKGPQEVKDPLHVRNPRENREILRRENRSASSTVPFYIARMR